jgi:hypothetical protein
VDVTDPAFVLRPGISAAFELLERLPPRLNGPQDFHRSVMLLRMARVAVVRGQTETLQRAWTALALARNALERTDT